MPMFPLGTVLFPHAVLPLHVFEPRYRSLMEECLSGECEFGVVLIERGSEVGGGDTRFPTGTVAQILRADRFPDGRFYAITCGTRRLRVTQWLAADPYPRAEIERLDDGASPGAHERVPHVQELVQRLATLATELGGGPHPGLDLVLDPEPLRASYQAAAAAGLGPLDAQRLLELDDAADRLATMESLLDDAIALLEFRLRS
jgi:Lon protease-like protein